METQKSRQGNLVTPGDKICVIEEYLPGSGTYDYIDGWVRSALVGRIVIDRNQRMIVVRQVKNRPYTPKPGDIVIGVIASMSDDLAFINIIQIEGKTSPSTSFTGVLHISQASDKYVETMYDVIRLGDIIRAKVLNDRIPYQLSLKGPQFGVIAAMCSKCGGMLKKKSEEILYCPRCGNVEKRKVSIKYMVK
ncbi:exosome complex RNA-binding protein Csl4 [Desulfurococcaceae archaeon MEX13E-LK6-19]|nr:exosome complex RNA-binding protein Csl4 [Desulfurococcaceae archaeon MEX13E-LK6-19]